VADFLQRLRLVEFRVVRHRLGHLVEAVVGGVVLYHVEDELFLNSLLGGIGQFLRRAELHFVAYQGLLPEQLQRLVLGCGCEREVAGVGQQLARGDALLDFRVHCMLRAVLFKLLLGHLAAKGFVHPRRGFAALAGMRLVDQQRKISVTEVTQLVEDERELLHRSNDDLLAPAQIIAQFLRVVGVAEDRCHVVVPLNGASDLCVQCASVGDNDDGVELRRHRVVLEA